MRGGKHETREGATRRGDPTRGQGKHDGGGTWDEEETDTERGCVGNTKRGTVRGGLHFFGFIWQTLIEGQNKVFNSFRNPILCANPFFFSQE